jgi:predicted Fe-S protein YdhL (DUF1289 family)
MRGSKADLMEVNEDGKKLALQHAIDQVSARARTLAMQAEAASPCISVCSMNARSGLCDGCFRTRDEIAGWSRSDNQEKLHVWKLIQQRMMALQS